MTATLTAEYDLLNPQIGWEIMAGHPEWAHLAEPAKDYPEPEFLADQPSLIAAFSQALLDDQIAEGQDKICLQSWDDAAWQVATTHCDPGLAEMRHQQLAAATDRWLPALRDDNAAAAKAIDAPEKPVNEAEPVTLAVAAPAEDSAETGEPDAAQADPGPGA